MLDEANRPARQARYPSGALTAHREVGGDGTQRGPKSRIEVIAHALRDILIVPPLSNAIGAKEVVIRAPSPAPWQQRAGGTANRSAGRLLTGRTRQDARHRSYSSDSEKSMSPVSDQLRFTNEKSVPPVQPATDGNATP